MKKLFTIFLLFIISVQCLPVKELGKMLFESSFVEDDACEDDLAKKETKDFIKDFHFFISAEMPCTVISTIAFCKKRPLFFMGHIADVVTPPPNA